MRPHFGTMGLAPAEADFVSSIPPSYTGGNIDDWRIGKGAQMYYPVAVPGALFLGRRPARRARRQRAGGTAIECSLTGDFEFILHKKATLGHPSQGLDYPLLETARRWSFTASAIRTIWPELGPKAQTEIYAKSTLDLAMRDAFRKMRRFLMTTQGLSEDEAISLMSVGVDFGVTQVVDGNWGVHGTIRKNIFRCD